MRKQATGLSAAMATKGAKKPTAQALAADPAVRPLAPHGTNQNTRQGSGDIVAISSRGSEYLAARIARDRPDILERMKTGEFQSVRQAAVAAGIVRAPTALDLLKRAWAKANKKERQQFLDWVAWG